MIFRSIGLGAACLALAAESIMIPPTVSLPGLTEESLNRLGDTDDDGSNRGSKAVEDQAHSLPIPGDFLEKMKDLNLGVSKPLPNWESGTIVVTVDDADDLASIDWSDFDLDFDLDGLAGEIEFDPESFHLDAEDMGVSWIPYDPDDFEDDYHGAGEDPVAPEQEETKGNEHVCPSGSSLDALICRIRATVAGGIEQVKPYFSHHNRPCPKKLAAMAKEKASKPFKHPVVSGGIAKFWPYFHPDEAMPVSHHHHQHHHEHHNKFAKVLHNICHGLRIFVTSFLVPVLIGAAAGMAACLLGMCVGTLLAWCWIKVVRRGKRGNASGRVMLDESDSLEAATVEKDGLLKSDSETEEAPPTYVERE